MATILLITSLPLYGLSGQAPGPALREGKASSNPACTLNVFSAGLDPTLGAVRLVSQAAIKIYLKSARELLVPNVADETMPNGSTYRNYAPMGGFVANQSRCRARQWSNNPRQTAGFYKKGVEVGAISDIIEDVF
jgi:hypothetical protein